MSVVLIANSFIMWKQGYNYANSKTDNGNLIHENITIHLNIKTLELRITDDNN
jgi:hypothetical protein